MFYCQYYIFAKTNFAKSDIIVHKRGMMRYELLMGQHELWKVRQTVISSRKNKLICVYVCVCVLSVIHNKQSDKLKT